MKLSEVRELKECQVEEANRLLKMGFGLIKPPTKIVGADGEYMLYVLGKA